MAFQHIPFCPWTFSPQPKPQPPSFLPSTQEWLNRVLCQQMDTTNEEIGCESWTIKKAERRRIDAFELWCWRRLFESPLDCKEIQPVHPKGNQSWIFTGRTVAEAETPILWLPDAKNQLFGKDPDAGKDWRWEEKGTTEDEIVGWDFPGKNTGVSFHFLLQGIFPTQGSNLPHLLQWTTLRGP